MYDSCWIICSILAWCCCQASRVTASVRTTKRTHSAVGRRDVDLVPAFKSHEPRDRRHNLVVPAFKSHESRGSGVDEALVVWSLGGE